MSGSTEQALLLTLRGAPERDWHTHKKKERRVTANLPVTGEGERKGEAARQPGRGGSKRGAEEGEVCDSINAGGATAHAASYLMIPNHSMGAHSRDFSTVKGFVFVVVV